MTDLTYFALNILCILSAVQGIAIIQLYARMRRAEEHAEFVVSVGEIEKRMAATIAVSHERRITSLENLLEHYEGREEKEDE